MRLAAFARSRLKQAPTILVFVLVALAATWPLAAHITTHLPLGTEPTATVPYFNVWTLEWNIDRLSQGYTGYWQTPIFYPAEGTFAFSDPQPLTGLLATVFSFGNPATTYNLTLLTLLTLNGMAAYLLLRELQLSPAAAMAGGVLVQLLPFLSHERGVLHLQPIFGMLLALYAVVRIHDAPSVRRGLMLGFWVAVSMLTSEQLGLILLVALLPFGLYILFRNGSSLAAFLAAGLLVAVLAGPFLTAQGRILAGFDFQRSERSVESGSADWQEYLTPSQSLMVSGLPLFGRTHFGLYPGIMLVVLAFASMLSRKMRYFRLLLLISALLAFLLSFGLNLSIGDWQPYRSIWLHLPGFQYLRSPFRFGIWFQISVVLLVAFAVDALWRTKPRWIAVALLALAAIEIFPQPTALAKLPDPVDLSTASSPTVFLPYVQGSSASAYTQTAAWMLIAQPSRLNIVNGYSGYFPHQNTILKGVLAGFPDVDSLEALENLGVRSIVVSSEWWEQRLAQGNLPGAILDRLTAHDALDGYLVLYLEE